MSAPFPLRILGGVLAALAVVAPAAAQQPAADAQEQRPAQEPAAAADPSPNYVVGPNDALNVSVWNQEDVSGQYTVEQDGTFSFPLIGRVTAAGLTLRQLEVAIARKLADGFFKDPQVTVSIVEYRSQRVFLVGELRQPGTQVLSGATTLIEVLARAGSTTPAAADHLLVMRPAAAGGPAAGEDAPARTIKVDLASLQRGELSQNLILRDGDTVFVPRAATAYVFGQVSKPGSYPVGETTTVLQALSLAGGVTERGATNRIRIVRRVAGEEREIDVDLSSPVEPGDTIIVPERFF